jgi:hypothetical protein
LEEDWHRKSHDFGAFLDEYDTLNRIDRFERIWTIRTIFIDFRRYIRFFTVLLVFTVIFDSANSNSAIRMHVLSANPMRAIFDNFTDFYHYFRPFTAFLALTQKKSCQCLNAHFHNA